jgi:glycosyltransferase involved in cell wall biosynthesis
VRVVHLASEVGGGGAARSALNLHLGLLGRGVDSSMLVGEIYGDIPSGVVKSLAMADVEKGFASERDLLVWGNRTNLSNTHFSLNLPGGNPLSCELLGVADVVHLHWVSGCLSASSISSLASLGKPLVWTLHDMRPLTGGCHFSAGCEGFAHDCRQCPQLIDDMNGLAEKNKAFLGKAIDQALVHVVSPSSWMHERAMRATSFANNEKSFIPYGVDLGHFTPGDKLEARRGLGLDPEAVYILLAAHNNLELRKGFNEAAYLLEKLRGETDLSGKIMAGTLRILLCGHETGVVQIPGYRVDRAGYLDHQTMPLLYQSADLLLFTSLEDNMPNVVMEGLSCGLPIVGHDLGGVRDLVGKDGDCGVLFPIGETHRACSELVRLILDESSRRQFGKHARERMEEAFSLDHQAKGYQELYENLLSKSASAIGGKGVTRDEEYRVLLDAISEKTKVLAPKCQILMPEIESSRILLRSKWVRLGQALGICYKP